MIWLVLACADKDASDSGAPDEAWAIAADGVGDAMLLSGWSDGDTLRMVGGDLGGGNGDLLSWDGATFCVQDGVADAALWWIDGTVGGTFWMVGEGGTVVTSTGEDRSIETDMTLYGVDVSNEDVWVVGGDPGTGTGGIWRWNGDGWDEQLTDHTMFKVDQDGDGGALFVGDGATWVYADGMLTEVLHTQRLVTVHQEMAVGGSASAVVVEWDGSGWVEQDALYLNGPLNGLFVGERTWVAGNAGVMGVRGEDRWLIPDLPMTADTFHAVVEHDGAAWFLGGNFFSAGDNHGTIGVNGEVTLPALTDCD